MCVSDIHAMSRPTASKALATKIQIRNWTNPAQILHICGQLTRKFREIKVCQLRTKFCHWATGKRAQRVMSNGSQRLWLPSVT